MNQNREKTKAQEKAVTEINNIIKSFRILNGYGYYSLESFKKTYLDRVIIKTCKKYKVNRNLILAIGSFYEKHTKNE